MNGNLVIRSPRTLIGEPSPRALVTALTIGGGLLFALSLIFHDAFASAGITPPSILLLALLVVYAANCGDDMFHPARLLAALLALGFVIGPIVHAATSYYALPDGAERQRADLGRATWMMLAGAALAMLAMRATLRQDWRKDLRSVSRPPINRRTFVVAIAVTGFGVVALAAYLILTGISSVSLQGRGASYVVIPHEGRKAYLSLLAPLGLGGLLVVAARALERGSRLGFLLPVGTACAIGGLMALPGSRANFLYAIAPLFFMYVGYRSLPRGRWLIAAVAVLVIVLIYATSLRTADARSMLVRDPWRTLVENRPETETVQRLFVVDVAHTEPLLGAIDAYPATRPFLGGESAAIGFTGPPGWKFARSIGIRVDPPAGVTLTATAYGRDPSTFGAGLTATLPGELYANAGVPGVLLGLAVFGAVAGLIRRRAVSTKASGALALYAAEITILFAIFADYFGQFYRGGAVLLGVAVSLIVGGEKRLALSRAAAIGCVIVVGAGALLIVRRLAGAPPSALLTSMVPVYLILAALAICLVLRLNRSVRWDG